MAVRDCRKNAYHFPVLVNVPMLSRDVISDERVRKRN